MRVRFQTLKGIEVLANQEGRLLGSVRRLQIDSNRKTALGLVFKPRGISTEHWAQVSSIVRVGEDVVFLQDTEAVRDDLPTGRDVRDLLGLSVTSLDGKRLGTLADVVLDTESWAVAALVLDGGREVDVGNNAVFGEDTILVQESAASEIRPAGTKQAGFLSRVFNADEDEATGEKRSSQTRKPKSRGRRK